MTYHNLGLRFDTTVWVYREPKINSILSRLNSFHTKLDECFEQSISLQKTITPINQVKPGDWIYSFDGCIHKVERVNAFLYDGQIVGLNHNLSDKTLWLIETTTIPSRKQTKLPKSINDWSEIPRNMTELRKYLRNNPTRAEQYLWSALSNKKLGYKFRRQHSIGPYIVDFYSRDGNIVVEVDGAGHFTSSGIEYDLERNQFIESLGLKVIHVTNAEVIGNLESVVELIVQNCANKPFTRSTTVSREAAELECGDLVYFGQDFKPARILNVDFGSSKEDIFYELIVQDSWTYLTEVCMVGSI